MRLSSSSSSSSCYFILNFFVDLRVNLQVHRWLNNTILHSLSQIIIYYFVSKIFGNQWLRSSKKTHTHVRTANTRFIMQFILLITKQQEERKKCWCVVRIAYVLHYVKESDWMSWIECKCVCLNKWMDSGERKIWEEKTKKANKRAKWICPLNMSIVQWF